MEMLTRVPYRARAALAACDFLSETKGHLNAQTVAAISSRET